MKYVIYFIFSFLLWLLLTFSLDLYNLITGLVVASFCTFLFGRYFVDNTAKFFQPTRYFWLVIYLFVFIWECIKANFDVAYRVLSPALPIKPGIVKVPVRVRSDVARVFLANSITMTPGTITVDIIGDLLYVHWININTTDVDVYTHKISGRFEKYIEKIFE